MPRPRQWPIPSVFAALLLLGTGCTSEPSGLPGDGGSARTVDTIPPPESTLPGGRLTRDFVAERLSRQVFAGIGFDPPAAEVACAEQGLADSLSAADRDLIGSSPVVGDLPEALAARIFAVFDGCVSDDLIGEMGATILVDAGATEAQSRCVFRLRRERLGIGGMYRFSATLDGEFEQRDPQLDAAVDAIFTECGLDPAAFVAPTLPPDTDPPSPPPPTTAASLPTTVAGSTPGSTGVSTAPAPTTTSEPPVTLDRVGASSLPAPPPLPITAP